MGNETLFLVLKRLVIIGLTFGGMMINTVGSLNVDYYAQSCPIAETIVRQTVNAALQGNARLSAGLLRMHFHDCFVLGCDASILLDSTAGNKAEKDAVPNQSLRGYEVIDQAKQTIESHCAGVVSCADIVAMAARDAVYLSGGPYYAVPNGRRDGFISKAENALNQLPSPLLTTTDLLQAFNQLGLTAQELVALSGGHTLGVASCVAFKNRLSNFSSTSNVDPTLNPLLANMLTRVCTSGDTSTTPFDWTPITFDNAYFKALQMSAGVLTSDQTLFTDPRTRSIVIAYASSLNAFFYDFANAMVKMGTIGVKEGNNGQVRINCHRVN